MLWLAPVDDIQFGVLREIRLVFQDVQYSSYLFDMTVNRMDIYVEARTVSLPLWRIKSGTWWQRRLLSACQNVGYSYQIVVLFNFPHMKNIFQLFEFGLRILWSDHLSLTLLYYSILRLRASDLTSFSATLSFDVFLL